MTATLTSTPFPRSESPRISPRPAGSAPPSPEGEAVRPRPPLSAAGEKTSRTGEEPSFFRPNISLPCGTILSETECAPIRNANNLADYLTANRSTLVQAASGKIDPARVIKYCARLVENPKNRELLRCSLRSFALALCECLSLGITPEMGRGCFIPCDGEVTFVLGYQGMLELASRSGILVRAHNVFKGDKFEWYAGAEEKIIHRPNIDIRRCEETFLCSYCVSTVQGAQTYDVMLKNEIDAVRDRAGEFNMTWASDYLEMARKTVVRRASKFWPLHTNTAAE